jgi:glutamate-1-semialdehyde 2,1-aminomutase
MPVGAFGGRREIMEMVAPLGGVYQAGTLSGNPIAMIAGKTLLEELKNNPSIYKELDEKTAYLKQGLEKVLIEWGNPFVINQLGSMISVHFSDKPVSSFNDAAEANNELFKKFFHAMLNKGIYLPPSPYESWFLNNALTYEDLDETIQATKASLAEL